MIQIQDGVFSLHTDHTSYIFDVTPNGHLRHIYYGRSLPVADVPSLALKTNITLGTTVDYAADTPNYSLDVLLLEWSGIGKGDYRHSPTEMILPDGSFVSDFVYSHYEISDTAYADDCGLPFAVGKGKTLFIYLNDRKYPDLTLVLSYTVFPECDVIARNTKLCNGTQGAITLRRFMSLMLDLPESDYTLLTLDGGWAKESHIHERPVSYGIHITDSTTGASSNRHNAAFLLRGNNADEVQGEVFGFNLIYSGNHYSAVEKCNHDTLRLMCGISPHCFQWEVAAGDSFTAPQAVMSWSDKGINGMAQNMHRFVNEHIIRPEFQYSPRPVVINNWESTFFDFKRAKLLQLAKTAKRLGVELFVLDDGWFGQRSNDHAGLGDWVVNEKKLPGGIKALCRDINNLGLQFGLWFEPECVNEDSDLYRTHPDWVIQVPGRKPSIGRNQMTLDLTRTEVRDYIVDAVDQVLSCTNIEYVKWDYNRHISDMYSLSLANQGEFFHRYILGLYDVLRRIFVKKHPRVLLESCASGGNRFDLGMLCFSPQIWSSDNTDAGERLEIQRGLYTFYPPSCVSCHVSMVPNQQTLRSAPLSTRFNVAAFGVLGYELDFGELTPKERKEVAEQIAFYKTHRKTFQYGRFSRYFPRNDRESWQIEGEGEIMAAIFNLSYHASPARDTLRILSARPGKRYRVKTVKQHLRISRFGGLIKHVTPVHLNPEGAILRTVDRHYAMTDGQECYTCSGEALRSGIQLAMQYSGTGYDPTLRITGDWGSTLYAVIEERKEEHDESANEAQ